MFKGLRTKIESEQKGQSIATTSSPQITRNESAPIVKQRAQKNDLGLTLDVNHLNDKHSGVYHDKKLKPHELLKAKSITSPIKTVSFTQDKLEPSNSNEDPSEKLQSQLDQLNNLLNVTSKERDEFIEQNSQLYQLIEKLRRNLEQEKQNNSSLQTKLSNLESEFSERNADKKDNQNRVTSFSIKAFDVLTRETNASDNVEVLQQEISDLTAQLSKTERQLKIRQQNYVDLKRTLQKELLDHSRTQQELERVQSKLKDAQSKIQNYETIQQNGSTNSTSQIDVDPKKLVHSSSDKVHEAESFLAHSGVHREASYSSMPTQLDRISCQSQSSASVDEFEQSDHQHKEVSQEYLKNVLYRYMTSTDTETTQHLIKVISVIMEFTPEQSAAIKSAMYARNSWLRLG